MDGRCHRGLGLGRSAEIFQLLFTRDVTQRLWAVAAGLPMSLDPPMAVVSPCRPTGYEQSFPDTYREPLEQTPPQPLVDRNEDEQTESGHKTLLVQVVLLGKFLMSAVTISVPSRAAPAPWAPQAQRPAQPPSGHLVTIPESQSLTW